MTQLRALVTGAGGFLGRWLLTELQQRDFDTIPLSSRALHGAAPIDLADEGAVRARLRESRPDVVFHLVGSFEAVGFAKLLHVNCGLAAVLLDALAAEGLADSRVVFVGTAAEYGPADVDEGPVRETREARPTSAYGATKLAQTQLALAAARGARRALVVRPSNVIGPGMSERLSIGSFARQASDIRRGTAEPVMRVGDLATIRDFVDVRDVARAMVDLALTERAFGRIFNVSRGSGHSIGDALGELLAAFGVAAQIESDPTRGSSQSGGVSRFVASCELLASHVKYEPRSLSDSMRFLASSDV